jgi:hypothetical protein
MEPLTACEGTCLLTYAMSNSEALSLVQETAVGAGGSVVANKLRSSPGLGYRLLVIAYNGTSANIFHSTGYCWLTMTINGLRFVFGLIVIPAVLVPMLERLRYRLLVLWLASGQLWAGSTVLYGCFSVPGWLGVIFRSASFYTRAPCMWYRYCW